MASRATRADATARNRETLLAAARRVFLERGFHGATLEAIALEAGFSKGVVYSQFDSKADLFLALLDNRRAERAEQNAALARDRAGGRGVLELMRFWDTEQEEQRAWTLLVMEFRVHAARDAALAARYSALHARTVAGVVELLDQLYRNEGSEPPIPLRSLAVTALALGNGIALERTADPSGAVPADLDTILASIVDRDGAPRKTAAAKRTRRTT